jgi:RNA polymerase sigma-70 factor (ECF subfamily)
LVPNTGGAEAPREARASDSDELRALVHEARSGDVRAFATVVDLYYARALRFAMHMLASRPDAEEAVQDTFVRLYRAFPTYREEYAFEPWLFRILANRCRTAGARARRHAQLVEYGDVPDVPSGGQDGDSAGWRDEIRIALSTLPVEQREAFLMRHVEAWSYEDMSVATGAGVSALKMRVKRACDALRLRLTEVDRV